MGKALWGLSEWYGYRATSPGAEDAATRAIEIFERIGDPFWVSWSRFTRAFGRVMARDLPGAARDLGPTLREFWAAATFRASCSSCRRLEHAPARRPCRRRLRGRRRRAAASSAETGLHLATSGRARTSRSSTPTPRIPSSGPPSRADAHGRATRRWSARIGATPPRSPRRSSGAVLSVVRWRACTPRIARPPTATRAPLRADPPVDAAPGRRRRTCARRSRRADADLRELRRPHGRAQVQADLPLRLLPVVLGLLLSRTGSERA